MLYSTLQMYRKLGPGSKEETVQTLSRVVSCIRTRGLAPRIAATFASAFFLITSCIRTAVAASDAAAAFIVAGVARAGVAHHALHPGRCRCISRGPLGPAACDEAAAGRLSNAAPASFTHGVPRLVPEGSFITRKTHGAREYNMKQ